MTKYDFKNFTKSGNNYTNKNAGNVTFAGANGVTVIGVNTDVIDNAWKTVSFEIDVPAAVTNGTVSLTLDNALGFDINNVSVTKTASYAEFADENGNALLLLAEGEENQYIHLTDTAGYSDKVIYKSDITLDTSKTYILTMDMRAAASVN